MTSKELVNKGKRKLNFIFGSKKGGIVLLPSMLLLMLDFYFQDIGGTS
jgi:hypothetical protein